MDARQVSARIEEGAFPSVPGRVGRHRVVINPAIDFLAFRGRIYYGKPQYGASRRYQAIQSHTERHRAIQGHTGPFRAIYQAIMCDTSPQPFSLGVALSPYFVHRSSSSSASRPCRRPSVRRPSQPPYQRSQEITTDAKYRGICHITQRRARNCDSRRDKWWCSRAGTGYFGYFYLMDTRHVELTS